MPETTDLLELLAHAPDPGADGAPPHDGEAWLALGARLGLEGLVLLIGKAPTPQNVAQAQQQRAAAATEQAWIAACTREALDALHDAGVDAAALKGPLLAARIYPAGLVRRSTDVDLLVRPEQLESALMVLRQLDYRLTEGHETAHHLRHHHHVILHRPASPPLELHWAALHALGTRISADALFDLQGHLEPHAELVYLAAHAASHDFERPLWLIDLAAYLRAHPEIELARLDALARQWHVWRAWRQAQLRLLALLGPQALPWPVAPPTPRDRLLQEGQRLYMRLPRKAPARFAVHVACLLGTCDNPWRAGWLGQFSALRAAGDLARQRGLPVPHAWPPLPPYPPWP